MKTLLNPDEFARRLASATRKAGFPVKRQEGLTLHCVVAGAALRCNLASAYSAYKGAPDRLEDIVQAHLAALRTSANAVPTIDPTAGLLLPLLNQAAQVATLQAEGLPPALHRPLAPGLVITYVIDGAKSMSYVNARLLAMIGQDNLPLDVLHRQALQNLRTRTRTQDVVQYGFGDSTFVVYESADGFAATRVLLDDLMASWAERLPGRMLVGVPNRDFLIACGDRNPHHVAAIASQVRRDARRMPRPLSGELLLWENGQVRPHRAHHH